MQASIFSPNLAGHGKPYPCFRLFIHPEMERPAMLNRSMPSTAGVIIGIPPVDEADLSVRQLSMENAIYSSQRKYIRWRALFPGTKYWY
jgi:hypothetical protein